MKHQTFASLTTVRLALGTLALWHSFFGLPSVRKRRTTPATSVLDGGFGFDIPGSSREHAESWLRDSVQKLHDTLVESDRRRTNQ